MASKENKNKYLEVGNYDPLGYINLNKIFEKLHVCWWNKIMEMHFNQSKGVLLWHVLGITNLMDNYLILMHPQLP